jgi:hypothetical protein
VDNLHICLRRQGLCAPNHTPADGLTWKTNHSVEVQRKRHACLVCCGPGGVVHDYVPFYFGYLSPMLLQLKTGQVEGYDEGQRPLIYLISTAQAVERSGTGFVFSDGHGIAAFTNWFDDLADLDKVDWHMVKQRYWADNVEDMDRQRRKQAEFLVHRFCDWSLIKGIAVIDRAMEAKVGEVLAEFPEELRRPIRIKRDWYY